MAIAVRLDDLLHERRMTLTELAEKIDITLANLSILKTGKARAIRFSTLEAICRCWIASRATCSNLSKTKGPAPCLSPPAAVRDNRAYSEARGFRAATRPTG